MLEQSNLDPVLEYISKDFIETDAATKQERTRNSRSSRRYVVVSVEYLDLFIINICAGRRHRGRPVTVLLPALRHGLHRVGLDRSTALATPNPEADPMIPLDLMAVAAWLICCGKGCLTDKT